MAADPSLSWPPPDPDKMPFTNKSRVAHHTEVTPDFSQDDVFSAFRQRQAQDIARRRHAYRASPKERDSDSGTADDDQNGSHWADTEGHRLNDFGVDVAADYDCEDEVPLSQLLEGRKRAS